MSFKQFIKQKIQTAKETFFNNSGTSFVSDNVQDALEEITTSASPGFSFGRKGNISSGTWLQNESVPSNKAGRFVYITDPVIDTLFVASEDIDTYDIQIYYHDGDSINLTLVSTSSIVAARGGTFTLNVAIPTGKQLALLVSSGSAKNVVAGLELSGTN